MKVVLIDAYDSFVYIISQYLQSMGLETLVIRNDSDDLVSTIDNFAPSFLILGPGPGHPIDSGYVDLVRMYEERLPILGVCLGHQAIGMAYGEKVVRSEKPKHGKTSVILHDGKGVYQNISSQPFTATRYHSLIIDESEFVGKNLCITSRDDQDNFIMGVRHNKFRVEGVQFHPESILTENGMDIFKSFVEVYVV